MTTPIKITRLKAEIWSAARSWIFWVIMAIVGVNIIGIQMRIDYLSYPFVFLLMGILPLVGSAFSQKLGILYVIAHVFYDRNWPFNKEKKFVYSISDKFALSEPQLREPVFYTMINVFGMLYAIYAVLQYFLPSLAEPGMRFLTVVLLMLPCLVLSSALNVSVWLFRLVGFTYENKDEGDRMNFGKEMRSKFGHVIGIGAAILFGYMFFKSPADFGNGIAAILFVVIFCTLPTLFSYYLLKRRGLERMKKEFREKLLKYTDIQNA